MAESPTYTRLLLGDEAVEYRSVPGRATSPDRRRIDLSSWVDVQVTFYRLRPGRNGIDQYLLGAYVVAEGNPLIWPVPDEAAMEDVLVVIETLVRYGDKAGQGQPPSYVSIMDFWRTN